MNSAIITGASRGIGKATAGLFLAHGWKVVGTSTNGEGWTKANLTWVELDLSDPQSIAQAAKEIAVHGPFNILIDNAGYLADREKDFDDKPIQMNVLRKTLEVNLIGTVDLTERLLPNVKDGGHIVLLGSVCGSLTEADAAMSPAYSISKAGLSMYTRQLAGQMKDRGITVSIVDPGWVKTDMGGPDAVREVEEPAKEIYDLATSNVSSGKFWRHGKERSW